MKHRDHFTADRKEFLGRIEPGDGAWEYMLGRVGSKYDEITADLFAEGHVSAEDNTYVTAIHEDGDCRFYGEVPA